MGARGENMRGHGCEFEAEEEGSFLCELKDCQCKLHIAVSGTSVSLGLTYQCDIMVVEKDGMVCLKTGKIELTKEPYYDPDIGMS